MILTKYADSIILLAQIGRNFLLWVTGWLCGLVRLLGNVKDNVNYIELSRIEITVIMFNLADPHSGKELAYKLSDTDFRLYALDPDPSFSHKRLLQQRCRLFLSAEIHHSLVEVFF